MNMLIKAGSAGEVRPLGLANHSRGPFSAKPSSAADPAIEELAAARAEVERLQNALILARAEGAQAATTAYDEGHADGLKAAKRCEEDQLAVLREGLADAVQAFGSQLERLDGLAPALARQALAKLFDAADNWAAMAEKALALQLGKLRRASVLAVLVSPSDFRDTAALEALGTGSLRVAHDTDLRAGACRIECKLGQVEIDMREQWTALAALLDEMSAG
jgi:flagellar biosynthesis/type III secretory pathway protein FliH